MTVQIANNATSRLASSISSSDTTISVQAGDGAKYPTLTGGDTFPVTLTKADGQLEICRCTARTGDVLTVMRGQENTTAKAFAPGDRIELRMTKGAWDQKFSERLTYLASGSLPTTNQSDIYKAGEGFYRWNGTAYDASTLVTGELNLSGTGNGSITGNFDGLHASDTWSVVNKKAQPTYLPVVPPSGQNSAFLICRSAASANSAFGAFGYNGTLGHVELTFSRHGSGAVPAAFRVISANTECARVTSDGVWVFGPYLYVPSVSARTNIYYTGGGTQYGTVYRPQLAADGVAIQFQSAGGGVAGFIQSNNSLSVLYSTTSDYRSKTVLGELSPAESLDKILALRPITFHMHGAPMAEVPLRGFVAHELQEVIPQAVTGHKDQTQEAEDGQIVPVMQGVDLSKLVPDLVAAIQALQGQINALKQQVQALIDAA